MTVDTDLGDILVEEGLVSVSWKEAKLKVFSRRRFPGDPLPVNAPYVVPNVGREVSEKDMPKQIESLVKWYRKSRVEYRWSSGMMCIALGTDRFPWMLERASGGKAGYPSMYVALASFLEGCDVPAPIEGVDAETEEMAREWEHLVSERGLGPKESICRVVFFHRDKAAANYFCSHVEAMKIVAKQEFMGSDMGEPGDGSVGEQWSEVFEGDLA